LIVSTDATDHSLRNS